jgi:hypothetical protein
MKKIKILKYDKTNIMTNLINLNLKYNQNPESCALCPEPCALRPAPCIRQGFGWQSLQHFMISLRI